jgi:hypothetical protein
MMQFECEEFFEDLALVLDAPPQTEENNAEAEALAFLQKHGIKN